jgi:hypothetical protein
MWKPQQCFCEDDIPPYSVFFAKCLQSLSPYADPVLIVTRCGLKEGTPTGAAPTDSVGLRDGEWNTLVPYFDDWHTYGYPDEYAYTLVRAGPWIFANGNVVIPAKIPFVPKQPAFELCWVKYDETSSGYTAANSHYFIPRDDSWSLIPAGSVMPLGAFAASTASPRDYATACFRRFGPPDTTRKIVAVYAIDSLVKWQA